MPIKEATFWVGLTALGIGPFFWAEGGDKMLIGIVLTVFGIAAVAYAVVAEHYPALPKLRAWAALLLITWAALGYDIYDRHSTVILPEFDAARHNVAMSYGQNGAKCFADVDGEALKTRRPGYKLAIGCFVWGGGQDMLDAPNMQVSNLYDIKDQILHLEIDYSQGFQMYLHDAGATGIDIALLIVPDGVQPSQFSTLRQARALGVLIPKVASAVQYTQQQVGTAN